MSRRFKVALDIDDRTNAMSDEALVCRTWGHKWARRAASRKRTLELLAKGLAEYIFYCENGCGCTKRRVLDFTGTTVEQELTYPKNGEYLMPHGEGRLRRDRAFPAFFARENPSLV